MQEATYATKARERAHLHHAWRLIVFGTLRGAGLGWDEMTLTGRKSGRPDWAVGKPLGDPLTRVVAELSAADGLLPRLAPDGFVHPARRPTPGAPDCWAVLCCPGRLLSRGQVVRALWFQGLTGIPTRLILPASRRAFAVEPALAINYFKGDEFLRLDPYGQPEERAACRDLAELLRVDHGVGEQEGGTPNWVEVAFSLEELTPGVRYLQLLNDAGGDPWHVLDRI